MPLFNCLKPSDPDRPKSKELDREIVQWMKEYNKAIKLLLLGVGESGKTTILKQMAILHTSGFSKSERQEKAYEVRMNILVALQETLEVMQLIHPPISLDNQEHEQSAEYVQNTKRGKNAVFDEEFYVHASNLWSDQGVKAGLAASHEFPIIDGAKYFLDKLAEIKQSSYMPSDEDILRSRRRTCEIQKIEFEVKIPMQYGGGAQTFWMFDVGGQRGERKKWIQVFEGITAILYLVAASGFDSRIREDYETNVLTESLTIFKQIWRSPFLRDAGFILFLNKQDLLKEKVRKGISIGDYFPDYVHYQIGPKDGDQHDEYTKTKCFIRDQFLDISRKPYKQISHYKTEMSNPSAKSDRQCYYHFTTATDTQNVKHVFEDVHSMIVNINVRVNLL